MSAVAERLIAVRQRLEQACAAAGRAPDGVRLLAVSKSVPAESIRAAADCGQLAFGESYLQEALAKQEQLLDLALEWHFIGPVQSNKTRELAAHFDWVQGVDRLKIAERLAAARAPQRAPLNICVQVNISGEHSKAGCAPSEAADLCHAVARLPGLRLRGLMAIPAPTAPDRDPREAFHALRELFEHIRAQGLALDTISAGMSDDLEAAIAEGSTVVRVGTAIFGTRPRTRT